MYKMEKIKSKKANKGTKKYCSLCWERKSA